MTDAQTAAASAATDPNFRQPAQNAGRKLRFRSNRPKADRSTASSASKKCAETDRPAETSADPAASSNSNELNEKPLKGFFVLW